MAEREWSTLREGGSYFEGPRWHEGRWYVSDFYRHEVLAIDPDGEAEQVMEVEAQPSGLGWLSDGSLLVVSMTDRRILCLAPDGRIREHADLSGLCSGHLNDMVVDDKGCAYVGHFGFDLMNGGDPEPASVIRVDPDGCPSVEAEEMMFPNGSVISRDGKTLIVAETMAARLTAFTIDSDGSLIDRRTWGELADPPPVADLDTTLSKLRSAPDGCTLDSDGHVWAADAMGARVMRVALGGEIVDEVPAPDGLGIFACMLGGPDGSTLLACAAPDFNEHARRDATEAVLLTCEVDATHAGMP